MGWSKRPKAPLEGETLAQRRTRTRKATQGKSAEDMVHELLNKRKAENMSFDYDRLLDSRAAGRIVASQVSDFLVFQGGRAFTLEVKEMKTGDRLPKGSFPQHPRMLRRDKAGCAGILLVRIADTGQWWQLYVADMPAGVPSWKISELGQKINLSELEFI